MKRPGTTPFPDVIDGNSNGIRSWTFEPESGSHLVVLRYRMTGSGAGEAISIRWGTGVIAGNIVTGKTRQGVKLWSAGSSDMNQVVSNKALRTTGLVSFLDEYRRPARNR